jgi:hypothetical protein
VGWVGLPSQSRSPTLAAVPRSQTHRLVGNNCQLCQHIELSPGEGLLEEGVLSKTTVSPNGSHQTILTKRARWLEGARRVMLDQVAFIGPVHAKDLSRQLGCCGGTWHVGAACRWDEGPLHAPGMYTRSVGLVSAKSGASQQRRSPLPLT